MKTLEADLLDGKRLINWLRTEGADADAEDVIDEIRRSRFHPFGIRIAREPGECNLKKGDTVVMHSCMEADHPKYAGKVWTCKTDPIKRGQDRYVVLLEGFSGTFAAEFLQRVHLPQSESDNFLGVGD